jgi:hypothetical protein
MAAEICKMRVFSCVKRETRCRIGYERKHVRVGASQAES